MNHFKIKNLTTFFKHKILILRYHICSAVQLQCVSKNFSMEMLNNFSQCTTCGKERLTQNFIPMKLKELLAEKCIQVLQRNCDYLYVVPSTRLFPDMSSFLWLISGKCSNLLCWIETYGMPIIVYMLLISQLLGHFT